MHVLVLNTRSSIKKKTQCRWLSTELWYPGLLVTRDFTLDFTTSPEALYVQLERLTVSLVDAFYETDDDLHCLSLPLEAFSFQKMLISPVALYFIQQEGYYVICSQLLCFIICMLIFALSDSISMCLFFYSTSEPGSHQCTRHHAVHASCAPVLLVSGKGMLC